MAETTEKQTTPEPKAEEKPQRPAQPVINLQALAEKVYVLLQNELRIEQERLGRR